MFFFLLLVELPNYSTEGTEEKSYESYYDSASSSGMEPLSTLDNMDNFDPYAPLPYDTYNISRSSTSRNFEKSLLLFAIAGLFLFH